MTNWNPLNNYWKREIKYRVVTGLIMVIIGLLIALLIGGCKKAEDVKPNGAISIFVIHSENPWQPQILKVRYPDANMVYHDTLTSGYFFVDSKIYKPGEITITAFALDSSKVYIELDINNKSVKQISPATGMQTLTYIIP